MSRAQSLTGLPSFPFMAAELWLAYLEWGVGVEIGVSGAKLLESKAKSLLNYGRTEQISRYSEDNGARFLTVIEGIYK